MAVDITNHLIPYTQVKRMLEQAWGEGHEAGWSDAHAWHDVTEGHVESDEYEDTPNPYQEDT